MSVDFDDINDIRRELRRAWAEIAKRPIKVKGGGATASRYLLKIIDGQTVFSSGPTTIYGISKYSGSLATVPSIYDPNGVGSTAGLFTATTGIGRAALYISGVLQSDLVLVVFDSASPIPTSLAELDAVASETSRSIPLVSDPTQSVTAYVPLFL
jgi:hypothetical protein